MDTNKVLWTMEERDEISSGFVDVGGIKIVSLDSVNSISISDNPPCNSWSLDISLRGNKERECVSWRTKPPRDEAFEKIKRQLKAYRTHTTQSTMRPRETYAEWLARMAKPDAAKPNQEGSRMNQLKEYFEKHRDVLFTIGLALLLDHFVFGGSLRERLKQMVNSMLDLNSPKALTHDGK